MQYTAASKKKGNAIRSKREWDIDHARVQATVLNKKLTTSTLRLVAEKLSRYFFFFFFMQKRNGNANL